MIVIRNKKIIISQNPFASDNILILLSDAKLTNNFFLQHEKKILMNLALLLFCQTRLKYNFKVATYCKKTSYIMIIIENNTLRENKLSIL